MTLFIILLSAITAIAITALIYAIIDVGSLFVVFWRCDRIQPYYMADH